MTTPAAPLAQDIPDTAAAYHALRQDCTHQPKRWVMVLLGLLVAGASLRRLLLDVPDPLLPWSWGQGAYAVLVLALVGLIVVLPTRYAARIAANGWRLWALVLWVCSAEVAAHSVGALWAVVPMSLALLVLLDWPDSETAPGTYWGAAMALAGSAACAWMAVRGQVVKDVFAVRVVLGSWIMVAALTVLLRELRLHRQLLHEWHHQSGHDPQPWRTRLLAHARQVDNTRTLQLVIPAAMLVLAGNVFSLFYIEGDAMTLNVLLVRVAFSLIVAVALLYQGMSHRLTWVFVLSAWLGLSTSTLLKGDVTLGLFSAAPVVLLPLLPSKWRWLLLVGLGLSLTTGWYLHHYPSMQAVMFALGMLASAGLAVAVTALRERMRQLVAQLPAALPPTSIPASIQDAGLQDALDAPQHSRANRWGWLTFVLTFGLFLLALSGLLRSQLQAQHERAKTVAYEKALLIRNLLEHAGHAAIALGSAIAPAGQGQAITVDSQGEFETLALPLLQEFQGVTALQYAPAGVIRWTVPLSGNEIVTGYDLLEPSTRNPLSVQAMTTGKMILIGPQPLKQGGWGLIGRNPIYGVPGQPDTFIGFTQALICLPEGLAPAKLDELAQQGLEFQLWRPHPSHGRPELILPRTSTDPVWPVDQVETADLGLSHVRWFLSVRPKQGFAPYQQGVYWAQLGLLLSIALALYVRKAQLLRYAAQERDDIRRQVQRLELERQLREVQLAQERIDDLLPLGVYRFHFGPQGQVVADHLSPVLCALFELEREVMLADLAPAFAKILPEDVRTMQATLHRAWQQPGPLHWRGRIRLQDESLRWLETRAVPHPTSHATTGYVGYIVDISEQVCAQEQISTTLQQAQVARTEAERANSAKSLFLATMSHEMRTPLNAIIGLGDLLGFSPLDAEQQNHLTELKRASRMLLGIINDVLDLAKIEAGEFELAQERLHLSPLLDEVRRLSQVSANLKGLTLDVTPLPPELGQRVYLGDPLRLRQILLNLVSNAIKFTAQGGIGLSVSASPAASAERMRLHFEVSDTGIGIPADLLPQLFHPFVQADSGNTRRFGGTGLGLSVVRELAERMDGGVQVRSQPGQGSTFCVDIELALLPDAEITPDGETAPAEVDGRLRLEGVRLLLVDDSDMNLEVAGQLLRREGAEVDTCSNGQQALEWLDEHGAQVDVVLMDVQMPVMDGNTAVGHIRSQPQLAQLPVIALTAGAMYSEREKSLQAGMSDYLTKPFERGQMVRLIRQHVQRYRGQPLPEGRLRPAAQPTDDWPHVDGIAQTQVRQRLNGDRALFIKLLQRLLNEFGDLASPPPIPEDEATCKPLKQHLHKLAGNAGLLGANSIYLLAKETETALRAQNWALAATSMQQLATQMAQLAQAAAPVLAQADSAAQQAPLPDQLTLDAAELALLRDELAQQQLSALAHYQRLTVSLKNALTASEFLALDRAMNTLNFRAALAQIQSL